MLAFFSNTWVKIAAVAAILVGTYFFGYHVAQTAADLAMKKYQLQQSEAETELLKSAHLAEQDLRAQITDLTNQGEQNVEKAKSDAQGTIDDLSAGNLRLRKRLAAVTVQLHRATVGPGSAVDEQASGTTVGLQQSDAEFLVRLAADADARSEALKTCVGMLQADRDALNKWYKEHGTSNP